MSRACGLRGRGGSAPQSAPQQPAPTSGIRDGVSFGMLTPRLTARPLPAGRMGAPCRCGGGDGECRADCLRRAFAGFAQGGTRGRVEGRRGGNEIDNPTRHRRSRLGRGNACRFRGEPVRSRIRQRERDSQPRIAGTHRMDRRSPDNGRHIPNVSGRLRSGTKPAGLRAARDGVVCCVGLLQGAFYGPDHSEAGACSAASRTI